MEKRPGMLRTCRSPVTSHGKRNTNTKESCALFLECSLIHHYSSFKRRPPFLRTNGSKTDSNRSNTFSAFTSLWIHTLMSFSTKEVLVPEEELCTFELYEVEDNLGEKERASEQRPEFWNNPVIFVFWCWRLSGGRWSPISDSYYMEHKKPLMLWVKLISWDFIFVYNSCLYSCWIVVSLLLIC